MITNQIIFKTFGIAYLIFITSSTVFANSNNDNSIFPLKSQFSKNLNSKNDKYLSSKNPREIYGFNTFEQKISNNYGIKVENNLNTIVENIDVIFEKNSAGLKVMVKRNFGGVVFLKYMDKKNLEKENLNKGTVEDNI
jgi:hypothetical protein